ncbi:MAG: FHA domain-containing protein [Deltaproteobacteria bacterium]|nr:FHA domain-containing protein [Deltaproteobacteria bacterium]
MDEKKPQPSQPPYSTVTSTGAELDAAMLAERVTAIRIYGTAYARALRWQGDHLIIGADPACDLPVSDPSVSWHHATLSRQGDRVVLTDNRSTNGTRSEGEPRATFQLVPGSQFSLGSVHFVAVNDRVEALRARLKRFLGFADVFSAGVDHAHFAATRRRHVAVLEPIGGGGVGLAHLLHETAPGGAWPFVMVDERIGDTAAEQLATLKRARNGALVVPVATWPKDARPLRDALAKGTNGVRLVLVAPTGHLLEPLLGQPLVQQTIAIEIPSIVQRAKVDAHGVELSRLLELALAEHGAVVGVAGQVLKPGDMASLLRHDWSGGHKMLDEMVSRLLLVRVHGRTGAADRLGVGVTALSNWCKRHGFA